MTISGDLRDTHTICTLTDENLVAKITDGQLTIGNQTGDQTGGPFEELEEEFGVR